MAVDTYQRLTSTTMDELLDRIDSSAARVHELARSAGADLPLPGSAWRVRDVAAHLLTVARRYTRGATLGDRPRDVDRINAEELDALGDTTLDDLLVQHRSELDAVRARWGHLTDLGRTFPFHGGATVDVAAALGNLVGEHLVHGYDVAAAARVPWPIADRDAVLVLNAVVQVMPGYVRADAPPVPYAIRFDLPGARPWAFSFEGTRLASQPAAAADAVDVVLTDPTVVLLALYGRIEPAGGDAWIVELAERLERP